MVHDESVEEYMVRKRNTRFFGMIPCLKRVGVEAGNRSKGKECKRNYTVKLNSRDYKSICIGRRRRKQLRDRITGGCGIPDSTAN